MAASLTLAIRDEPIGHGPAAPRRSWRPRPRPRSARSYRALRCKAEGVAQTIMFNLCGHDFFDLSAYEAYLAGKLDDYEYPSERDEALRHLPAVDG